MSLCQNSCSAVRVRPVQEKQLLVGRIPGMSALIKRPGRHEEKKQGKKRPDVKKITNQGRRRWQDARSLLNTAVINKPE